VGRRHFYTLVTGTASLLAVGSLMAQQPPTQPLVPQQMPNRPDRADRAFGPGRERWRNMSPEDRQHFQSNMERWRQLPPEERRELRDRAGWRAQRLKSEAEAAIRASGLQLEAEKQAQFEERYMQERKRIDQSLRKELQEKRQRELAPVVERLKKEFAQPQSSAAPSVTAPASPSK
jgi:hypothetical protein